MDYDHLPASKPAPKRIKNTSVFCVGGYAYVNWPQLTGARPRPVPMPDGAGRQLENDLLDGQEVEILSWRPRPGDGTAYCVRRRSDGTEWWLAVDYLRPTP